MLGKENPTIIFFSLEKAGLSGGVLWHSKRQRLSEITLFLFSLPPPGTGRGSGQHSPSGTFQLKSRHSFVRRKPKTAETHPLIAPVPPLCGVLFPSLLSGANAFPARPREPLGRSYFPSERSAALKFDIWSIDQPLRRPSVTGRKQEPLFGTS